MLCVPDLNDSLSEAGNAGKYLKQIFCAYSCLKHFSIIYTVAVANIYPDNNPDNHSKNHKCVNHRHDKKINSHDKEKQNIVNLWH